MEIIRKCIFLVFNSFGQVQYSIPTEVILTVTIPTATMSCDNCMLFSVTLQFLGSEILKRYNLVPVKNICTLFSPTPYFWGRTI